MKLNKNLTLIILISVLPFLTGMGTVLLLSESTIRKDAEGFFSEYSSAIAKDIEVFFAHKAGIVESVSFFPGIAEMKWPELKEALAPMLANISVTDNVHVYLRVNPDGTYYRPDIPGNPALGGLVTADDKDPGAAPNLLLGRDYFKILVADNTGGERRAYISNPLLSLSTGRKMVIVGASLIGSSGETAGLIGFYVEDSTMENVFDDITAEIRGNFGEQAIFLVFSENNTILSHREYDAGQNKYTERALNVNEEITIDSLPGPLGEACGSLEGASSAFYEDELGERYYMISTSISGTGYRVVLALPEAALYATRWWLFLSAAFVIVGLVAYLYMVNDINKQNRQLVELEEKAEAALVTLKATTVEKQEYLNILENVNDGLFLLDSSLRIGPYYSSSLETIFRKNELAGLDVMEVFCGFLDGKTRSVVKEFFEAAFNPKYQWRHVERLNPIKEVSAYFDNLAGGFTERHLEFDFRRVGPEGRIEQLFVVVRDTTERTELVEEIEKTKDENRQEMEMIQKILHVESGTLLAFLESAKQDAEMINNFFHQQESVDGSSGADNSEDYHKGLDIIFRHSHSLKGDAELLALDFIADQAEDLEQKIVAIRDREKLTGEDFLPLVFSCSALLSTLEKLNAIVIKWLKLSGAVREKAGSSGTVIDLMEDALKQMARRLAERYGKKVELTITGLKGYRFKPDKHKALKDILVQLVRNSIYHGIEKPEQRRKAGKSESGVISIRAAAEGTGLRIVYRDDGAGMDSEKIKQRALKTGIITGEEANAMNEQEHVLLIFHPGFSTAENPDRVAGKGVGLSLVTIRVKELSGKLSLKSRRGSYSEFTLIFPLYTLTGETGETFEMSAG